MGEPSTSTSAPLPSDQGQPVLELVDHIQKHLDELKLRAQRVSTTQSEVVRLEKRVRKLEAKNSTLLARVNELEQRLQHSEMLLESRERKLRWYRTVINDAFRNAEPEEERTLIIDEENPRHDFSNAHIHRPSEGSNWGIVGEARDDSELEIHQHPAGDTESGVDALEVTRHLLPSSPSTRVSTPPAEIYQTMEGSTLLERVPPTEDFDNEAPSHLLADETLIASFNSRPPQSPTGSETRLSTTTGEFRLSSAGGSSTESRWKIHFTDPPKASKVKSGPMSWRKIGEKAGLEEHHVADLRTLLNPSSFKLGVAFMEDKAFVHDPFFLEDLSRNQSYLIDWGSERKNQKLAHRIQQAGEGSDGVFHTFVYVSSRRKWHYVSAFKWTVEEVWDVWSSLTDQSDKEAIVLHLCDRNQSDRSAETVLQSLDCGELQQFCVKLASDQRLAQISRERCESMDIASRA